MPDTAILTLFISCPCGYWDDIPGIYAGDFAHAKMRARAKGWVRPRINTGPLDANGRMTAKGQCRECYLLELNDE